MGNKKNYKNLLLKDGIEWMIKNNVAPEYTISPQISLINLYNILREKKLIVTAKDNAYKRLVYKFFREKVGNKPIHPSKPTIGKEANLVINNPTGSPVTPSNKKVKEVRPPKLKMSPHDHKAAGRNTDILRNKGIEWMIAHGLLNWHEKRHIKLPRIYELLCAKSYIAYNGKQNDNKHRQQIYNFFKTVVIDVDKNDVKPYEEKPIVVVKTDKFITPDYYKEQAVKIKEKELFRRDVVLWMANKGYMSLDNYGIGFAAIYAILVEKQVLNGEASLPYIQEVENFFNNDLIQQELYEFKQLNSYYNYFPDAYKGFIKTDAWRELRGVLGKVTRVIFGEERCAKCGKVSTKQEYVVMHGDHIKPRSKNISMELDIDNLQTLCEKCNISKSNVDATDYRPYALIK